MGSLNIDALTQFGFGGFVALLVLVAFMTGRIFSKRNVDYLVQGYEKLVKDKDAQIVELKARSEALDKRNDLLAEQVKQLVQVGHTTSAVLTSLPVGRE